MKRNLLRASLPLGDAEAAAFSMQVHDYAIDWRHNFIVSVSTLRAVGHVLHKVDAVRFPEIKDEVSRRYSRWKRGAGRDAIFPTFIEDARNRLLKVYDFPSADSHVFEEEELGLVVDGSCIDVVSEGQLEGENVTSLVWVACKWWENELNEIAQHIAPDRFPKQTDEVIK